MTRRNRLNNLNKFHSVRTDNGMNGHHHLDQCQPDVNFKILFYVSICLFVVRYSCWTQKFGNSWCTVQLFQTCWNSSAGQIHGARNGMRTWNDRLWVGHLSHWANQIQVPVQMQRLCTFGDSKQGLNSCTVHLLFPNGQLSFGVAWLPLISINWRGF